MLIKLLLMVVAIQGISIVNDVQLAKAPSPMVMTDKGISMADNNEQYLKAPSPRMVVTQEGISINIKDEQDLKTPSSMVVTDEGISIADNDEQ
jgi:hypothetical protein